MTVISNNNLDVVKLFIDNGADVNYQEPKYNNTALIYALAFIKDAEKKAEIVSLLIKNGADVNLASDKRGTALDFATTLYNTKKEDITLRTVELLLKAGASPFLKPDDKSLSPYEIAKKHETNDLIELFEKYKKKLT